MFRKVLSLVLCLTMLLSCFSATTLSVSAAVVSAKSLFTVSTKPVDDNKLTYKISVTANQKNIAGTILVVEFDSTVLKPVNCGPAMRTNSTEGTVQNFQGNFVHGVTEFDKNMYSIAYMNTLSVSTQTSASDFFDMQFEIIDNSHPITDIKFYCKEYYSTSEADKTISVEDGLQEIRFFENVSTLEAPVTKSVVPANDGLKVTWEPVVGAAGYAIYRKTSSTDWAMVGTAPGEQTTEYIDTGLESGYTYIYSVSAANDYGESLRDNIGVSCKYVAKPVITKLENVVGGVQVSWSGTLGASFYNVMRREYGETEWKKITSRSATVTPTYKDTAVENGKTYEYDIVSGTDTFESISADIGAIIYYVASPTVSATNTVDGIRLEWPNNPYATRYEIFRKSIGLQSALEIYGETVNNYYVDTNVEAGKGYTYAVKTYTNGGESSYNASGYTITCVPPARITSLSAEKFSVKVEWLAVKNASAYSIYRKPADGGQWAKVGTATAGVTAYSDTSAVSGSYYVYSVCPVISNSESAKVQSEAIYFIKAPGNVVAENVDEGISLVWERSLGAVEYKIYRSVNGGIAEELACVNAAEVTSYLDNKVEFGNKYSYTVKAISDGAESLHSDVSNTLIRISAIGKAVPEIADGGVLVKWDAVENVQNYAVFRTSGEGWTQVATVDEAQYLDTRVISNTVYSYAVAAIVDGSRGVADTNAPVEILYVAPPASVSITNNTSSATVKWGQVAGATGYEIYRAEGNSETEFTLVKSVEGNVLSFVDADVASGKAYIYKIRCKSVEGYSAFSKETKNVFLSIPQISTIANSYTGITFSWKPVDGATSYRVYRKIYGAKYWTYITTVSADTLSYNDTETVNGKIMCYTVKAMNGSSASAYLAKCMTAVDAPILSYSNSPSGVYLKWDKNDAAVGYWIYRKTPGAKYWTRIACVTTTYYTDKNVKSGTDYIYTAKTYTGKILSSYNPDGWSLKHLSTPVITSVARGYGALTCSWKAVPGAAAYYVYRKADGAANWSYIAKTTSTLYRDTKVENGKSYTYTVKAYHGANVSSFNYSGVSAKYIAAPTVKVTNNISGVALTWDKIPGASSYYVYRKAGNAKSWTKIATVTKTNYVDTNVKSGTVYLYTVKTYASKTLSGCNLNGWKTYFLSTPKIVSALSYPSGVNIRWEKVPGATWYAVYRKGTTGTWTRIGTTTGNTKVTFIDTTAEKNKRYTYTVKACYGGYMSSYYTGEKVTVSY